MNFLNVLLIFALACCAHSYETSAGRCLDAPLIPDFSLEKVIYYIQTLKVVININSLIGPDFLSSAESGTKSSATRRGLSTTFKTLIACTPT
jgi:hypothetical protein